MHLSKIDVLRRMCGDILCHYYFFYCLADLVLQLLNYTPNFILKFDKTSDELLMNYQGRVLKFDRRYLLVHYFGITSINRMCPINVFDDT